MFIRFVVGTDGDYHRDLTGIVTEARLLRDAGELSPNETEQLENLYDWFNERLPVPPYSTSNWPADVVAWFRDDATDAVRRMWDVIALLRDHSVSVRMLTSNNPGRVVYEDDYQVVVEEWNRI